MSTTSQTADSFLDKLATDEAFRGRLAAQDASPESVVAFARSEGYPLEEADLRAACEARMARSGEALSEDVLAEVSGGSEDIVLKIFGIQIGIIRDGRGAKF